MSSFKSKTVLVTGGASGLGKLMAKKALQRKAKSVILWDIDEIKLNETTAEFEQKGYTVHPYIVDVSNKEDIEWAANDVLANIGEVDILFNNAGIVAGSKRFVEHTDKEMQATMFKHLGFTEEEAKAQFGFLMDAFQYGAPPHGGLAFGLDRLVAILGGQETIRDFIAFPKNNSGRDVMIDAPAPIDDQQLKELNIKLDL